MLHFSCLLFKFKFINLSKGTEPFEEPMGTSLVPNSSVIGDLNSCTVLHKAGISCDLKNCPPNDETACLNCNCFEDVVAFPYLERRRLELEMVKNLVQLVLSLN